MWGCWGLCGNPFLVILVGTSNVYHAGRLLKESQGITMDNQLRTTHHSSQLLHSLFGDLGTKRHFCQGILSWSLLSFPCLHHTAIVWHISRPSRNMRCRPERMGFPGERLDGEATRGELLLGTMVPALDVHDPEGITSCIIYPMGFS